MKKIIDKVDLIIHKISISFVIVLFSIIIVGMFLVNSIYLYIDKPAFQINNIWNYLAIIINMVGVAILILVNKFLKNKFPENKKITIILFVLYFIAEFIYLKLVPIKPFSDMMQITKIAQSNFSQGIEYLQHYPNNLPITILFYLMFKLHSGVMIIKLFNVACNIITIYFAYKTYQNIYKNENKLVLLFGIFSIPTFLYVNHMYNDIIFVALTTIILYIITKEKLRKQDIILLVTLSFIQYIIRQVGIILIIAECMYLILKKCNVKTVTILLTTFIICNLIYIPIQKHFIPKTEVSNMVIYTNGIK